jgi:DNA-binding transcriptional MerR regulator
LTLELIPRFTLSFMEDDSTIRDYWLAGELAKETGVSTDTLRHYERKGVLGRPRRGNNGYRLYPSDALERVQLVRRALSVGFTLDELARILGERDKGGSPCREVHKLAIDKLDRVEEQLAALTALRDDLRQTLADWDKRLSRAASGSQSRLLENLATVNKDRLPTAIRNGLGKVSPSLIKKEGRK